MNEQDELLELKRKYCETTDRILPVLPTFLAIIDFQHTGNFKLVASRMKTGYYGAVKDGKYIAPESGPYVGFLQNVTPDDMKKFRELMGLEKN